MNTPDTIVIGDGAVGYALAFGLLNAGRRVAMVTGARDLPRAAVANFGLIWVQGKGRGMPAYQSLTRKAAKMWPEFARQLEEISGMDISLDQRGGLNFCVGEKELEARHKHLLALDKETNSSPGWEMLDRSALQKLLPDARLGRAVLGASFCQADGAVNPLAVMAALEQACLKLKLVRYAGPAVKIDSVGGSDWRVTTETGAHEAPEVFVAAGLGNKELAQCLDLELSLRGERGQIIVTQRCGTLLDLPASGLRQAANGTIMIGTTKERTCETTTTLQASKKLCTRAMRILTELKNVPVTRQWAGLRVLTPDSYPVYARSHPGLTFLNCHSAITLAPVHATNFINANESTVLQDFGLDRFN